MAPRPRPVLRVLALALVLASGQGCASLLPAAAPGGFRWFVRPAPQDPWSPKISGWQARERGAAAAGFEPSVSSVSGPGQAAGDQPAEDDLRAKYAAFRHEHKLAMARDVADWIQRQARQHYRPDGPVDHWATLEETLAANGDDCDGLELLVYHFLRDAGFGEDEVFRAIVVRPSDGQHHMVTLWFDGGDDPFVIDPTGAMTSGLPRMSEVPGWVPLKLFSETREWSVEPHSLAAAPAADAAR